MSYHEQFRRAATERGVPEDEITRFAEHLRFAVFAETGVEGGTVIGRRGGLPRLPEGAEWPTSATSPLPMVVALDCAALQGIDGLTLPAGGWLYFFLDHEEDYCGHPSERYAQVVYVPAGAACAVTEPPEHSENPFCDPEITFLGPDRELSGTVCAQVPGWLGRDDLSDFQQELARDLPHRKELRALAGELWPQPRSADVYIGGYCVLTSEVASAYLSHTPEVDIAWDLVNARVKAGELAVKAPDDDFYYHLEAELRGVLREWVPIVQFEPDENHLTRWLVRHEDLAAGRADKVVSRTGFYS